MSSGPYRHAQEDAGHYALVCGCFTLSGLAALVYQTAWMRQFALVFGTSELAVATVLAAYMAGLALGARAIAIWLPRVREPIRLYAMLEIGIALAGLLLVPACLRLAEWALVSWLGGQSGPPVAGAAGTTAFYLLAAFATLLVPTALMGATLPLLARDGVHDDTQIGQRIGLLYACNTAGAVLGALLTAWWLLPALGLRATTWVAAGVNLLVAALAFLLRRLQQMRADVVPQAAEPPTAIPSAPLAAASGAQHAAQWILPLILLSGAVSFMQEVLWTRLLSRVVGSTIPAFGVMVASFLAGIALGGALGARVARDRRRAAAAFVLSQLAVAVLLLLAWYALLQWAALPKSAFSRALLGFAVLLPLALAIGVTYPLAVRVLAGGVADAPAASARVFGWNTFGAIIGALAGGFWLIPALRYEGALQLSVVLSVALAAAAAASLLPFRWSRVAPLGALALAIGLLYHPARPDALLRVSTLRSAEGRIVHYDVGRSADVVVVRDEASLDVRTNGLPEAATPVRGAPPVANVESWMSMLAVLARPDSADLLIVGFGGGNVVQAAPPSVRRIDVIELEPRVIAANRAIAPLRSRDPLADPRLHIILNDARGALALTTRRYDAIISQPSHPWTAGAAHLYTREFMQQAHDHLTPGGVFLQWMGGEFVDEPLLRSLVATLASVFREVRVYRPSNTTLLFMASDLPVDLEHRPDDLRRQLDRAPLHYGGMGINAPEDLVAALAMENDAAQRFAAGATPLTDDANRLATANVHARGRGFNGERLAALFAPYDPLADADSFVYRDLRDRLSFEYLWRRSILWAGSSESALRRMQGVATLLGDSDQGQLLRYMTAMNLQDVARGRQLLQQGLQRWPRSAPLLYAAAEQILGSDARPEAADELTALVARLPPEPAMVVKLTQAAVRQDWKQLSAHDQELASVPWTAQWGLQAAQLRAEWRLRDTNPELRQRYGDQGIAIADRAEVAQPDLFWHALRAASASGTDRPEVALESSAVFCATAEAVRARLSDGERQRVRARALELSPVLARLHGDERIDAGRLQLVEQRLQKVDQLLR